MPTSRYSHILLLLLSLTLTPQIALAQDDKSAPEKQPSPIIVELYTSRDCSSCPPADEIFSHLANNPNIIALSCPVSYWSQPWYGKDDLSQDFCDVRQHGYTKTLGTRSVYTPQMIVNGVTEFVGSHPDELDAALKTQKDHITGKITLSAKEGGIIRMELPALHKDGYLSYRLWGFGYKKDWTENVKSGENKGKTIHYANIARTYHNMGSWMGDQAIFDLQKPDADVDGLIVFAQANGYGEIVAAGKIEF